jgi:hypothetical protein
MFDFTSSIKAGIAAAETAAENTKEIYEVFDELTKQIESFSDGKLTVKLENSPDVWGGRNGLLSTFGMGAIGAVVSGANLASAAAALGETGSNVKKKISLMLIDTQNGNQKAALATVDISKLGYPVKFTYGDQVSNASDKESLGMILSAILQHPDSGKAMTRMMAPMIETKTPREPL